MCRCWLRQGLTVLTPLLHWFPSCAFSSSLLVGIARAARDWHVFHGWCSPPGLRKQPHAAYVFGRRKDEVFLKLKALLKPFGISRYYTDYWDAYTRHVETDQHQPGKRNTQKIERKHLTLRTRIKRLVRKTIYFSKSTQMHDIVIGLFVNRYEFGLRV